MHQGQQPIDDGTCEICGVALLVHITPWICRRVLEEINLFPRRGCIHVGKMKHIILLKQNQDTWS